MQRKIVPIFLLSCFILHLLLPSSACPWDYPFDRATNWGGTGLMEIPTARILGDGVIRASGAQVDPFRWFCGGMGIFPGFELTGMFMQITNLPSPLGSSYGSRTDKAFDIKYQVIQESKYLPAIALGYQDFFGTQLQEAQYIVLNRQIFPFDFSLGYGTKRLDGIFGGIEVVLHPRLHFMAEYNPIKYEKDNPGIRGVPQGAEWPVNFGLRFRILPVLDLNVSYQRGDTLGLSLNFQTDLGKPIIPHRADPAPLVDVDRKPYQQRDPKVMVEKIHAAIHEAGFTDVSVFADGESLTAEFANNKYLSNQKAVGRVLRILLLHAPSDTKKLVAIVEKRGMPILKVAVTPGVFEAYLLGEVPEDIFERLVEVETTKEAPDISDPNITYAGGKDSYYSYGVKPEFQTYLNDPSGIFQFLVGIAPWGTLNLWEGGEAFAKFEIPFYSDISSSNVPPPDTVREDSWKYLGTQYTFTNLLFDQAVQFTDRTFGRVSFGYLEYMYAGASGEVLHFFGDGSVAVGFMADWARKREPGSTMALEDFTYYDVLANAYFRVPKLDVTLQVQYGRFMAGDVGWLFTATREYDTGISIGGWWSFTDTSNLQGFSRNYDSKGVFINLPASIFLTHDSPVTYNYSFAPWTRDAAQTPYHWRTVFDIAGDLMPGKFKGKLGDIKQ